MIFVSHDKCPYQKALWHLNLELRYKIKSANQTQNLTSTGVIDLIVEVFGNLPLSFDGLRKLLYQSSSSLSTTNKERVLVDHIDFLIYYILYFT